MDFIERWEKIQKEIKSYLIGANEYEILENGIKRTNPLGETVFIDKVTAEKVYNLWKDAKEYLMNIKEGDKITYKPLRYYSENKEGIIKGVIYKKNGNISSYKLTNNEKVNPLLIVVKNDVVIEDVKDVFYEIFVFPSSWRNYCLNKAKDLIRKIEK